MATRVRGGKVRPPFWIVLGVVAVLAATVAIVGALSGSEPGHRAPTRQRPAVGAHAVESINVSRAGMDKAATYYAAHAFEDPLRFSEPGVLDRTGISCHDGVATLLWSTGNLEPTVPETGIRISLYLDRTKIATMAKGSTRGIWNDGPVQLRTVRPCSRGRHTVTARIDRITGSWGIPYANKGDRVLRGLEIVERY
jgi:hypothetical protein